MLERYSRGPFKDALAQVMQCRPTIEAMTAWAEKYPDKWGNLTFAFAKMAGFAEVLEINDLNDGSQRDLTRLSDAQLLQLLSDMRSASNRSQSEQPLAIEYKGEAPPALKIGQGD